MTYRALLEEGIRTGTVAFIVVMPAGYVFKSLDFRIGHYGPKVAEALFGNMSQPLLMLHI